MKRICFFALLGILTSCSPTTTLNYIPEEENLYIVDLARYSDQGFNISPEPPISSYKSIGLIDYVFYPAAKYTESQIQELNGEY